VFLLIGSDLLKFAKNSGKIRLICLPSLTAEDIDSITNGYETCKNIISSAVGREIDELIDIKQLIKNTEALVTLIALEVIEVTLD
jgi:hypothetical protein